MPTDNEIITLLKRIEKSTPFNSSTTYIELLKYLVECTQSEMIPKEYAIAEYIFGKNSENVDSSRVRSYIYHLRKKLNQYFENEGKREAYILIIPKGSYKVQFKEKKRPNIFSNLNTTVKLVFIGLCTMLFCFFLIILFLLFGNKTNQDIYTKSAFWKEYFEDDRPIQIIIGDFFIFSEVNSVTGEIINMRITDINNASQFEEYRNLKKNEGKDLRQAPYTLLHKNSAEWIAGLTRVFHPDKEFNTRVCSSLEPSDLHDYNLVFIGMQRSAGIFNSYFDGSPVDYYIKDKCRYIVNREGKKQNFVPQGDPEYKNIDYGFIAKYPGPKNNTIFIFSSLWDSATPEALRNFTMPEKMVQVEEYMRSQLGYVPQYFEIIIEVNGLERIGFESKIVYLNEVNNSN